MTMVDMFWGVKTDGEIFFEENSSIFSSTVRKMCKKLCQGQFFFSNVSSSSKNYSIDFTTSRVKRRSRRVTMVQK
jgi:hypothetical protein